MKMLLPLLFMISSVSAGEIQGIQMLKGAISTKVEVKTIKAKCEVDVEKVKNLMEEDSSGNPAYVVRISLSLSGDNSKKKIKIKYRKEHKMINLFTEGAKSEVKDLEYFSAEGATMEIYETGRIKSFNFNFEGEAVTCLF